MIEMARIKDLRLRGTTSKTENVTNCPSQGRSGSMNRGNMYGQGQHGKSNNSCASITSTRDSVI